MGCTTSKANKLEDKIALVMTIYEDIQNEIKEKRQQYFGKCVDLQTHDDEDHENHHEHEDQKKNPVQTEKHISASNSQRSTVIFTSKKSLEAAELERKKSRVDVWRFSGSLQCDAGATNSRIQNKSIINAEEFKDYMLFLKDISSKFEKIKQKQLSLIEQYYNSDKQDIQVEFKKLHYKIETAQKKKSEIESCINRILNQEQFTPLPDGNYAVSHF